IRVPFVSQRLFFADKRAAADYDAALARLSCLGLALTEIDMDPFYEAARLLYGGPWLAERYLVARKLLQDNPDALHPVTREILAGGAKVKATDPFCAFYPPAPSRPAGPDIFQP